MKTSLALLLLTVTSVCAHASNLGIAEGYTVFTFGDFSGSSDSQGRIAVGGNATLSNFGIGDSLGSSNSAYPYSLVVGGNLSFSNGQSDFGGIAVGGNAGLTNTTINGSVNVTGGLTTQNGQINGTVSAASWSNSNTGGPSGITGTPAAISSIVNFSSFQSTIDGESSAWGALSSTGSASLSYGTLTLTGTDSSLNVFDLTSAQLASATGGFVINAPAGSTVLINVSGTSVTFPNTGYSVNGAAFQDVLFNFSSATTLSGSGGFYGSILAPNANFTFNNGQINGTVIAQSMNGSGETHYDSFMGNLPDIGTVPEPGSLTLLSTGASLMAACMFLRRRRKTQSSEAA